MNTQNHQKTVLGVCIDPERHTAEIVTVPMHGEDYLNRMYDLIRCDTIDIVRRSVCGMACHIACDDMGRLTDRPVSAVCRYNPHDVLVGPITINRLNGAGDDVAPMSKQEAQLIISSLKDGVLTDMGPVGSWMDWLVEVD